METASKRISVGMIAFLVLIIIYGRLSTDDFLISLGVNMEGAGTSFIISVVKFLVIVAIFGFSTGYMFLDAKITVINTSVGLIIYFLARNLSLITSNGVSVWEDLFIALLISAVFIMSMRIFADNYEYGYV